MSELLYNMQHTHLNHCSTRQVRCLFSLFAFYKLTWCWEIVKIEVMHRNQCAGNHTHIGAVYISRVRRDLERC